MNEGSESEPAPESVPAAGVTGDPGATPPVVAAPGSPAPILTRAERRARAVGDALRTLLRDLHAERFGGAPPQGGRLDLAFHVTADPGDGWALVFDPPLGDQALAQMEDVQALRGAYRAGAAHCFRCGSSVCEHAAPPSLLSVFRGYDAAGRPLWSDFAQLLIEQKDERVDRLFRERGGGVVAVMQLGRDLRGEQLASFGRSSKTYAVLGQVTAGYFILDDGESRERAAVTLQAVESRSAAGELELHLNFLAGATRGDSLEDLLASGWSPALHRARAIAAREIEGIQASARSAREAGNAVAARRLLQRIPGVLRHLAEFIERGGRQAGRRTLHVEERRQDRRPVHKALDDARAARDGQVFADEKSDTVIVCGDQGRVHAFNREGRHVTSFILKPAAVEFRLRTRRWRAATPEESAALRERLAAAAPPEAGLPPSG